MFGSNAILALVVLSSLEAAHGFVRPGLKLGSCGLSFISSMRAYDCVGLNWSEVPQNLPSSTEILDISTNRLRQLTNSSFKRYPNIKKLYLNDNMIMTIESGTFDSMTDLETLDLSMNALIEVPISIFHLPELKHLMLGKNLRLDLLDLISRAIPITAPIKYLDISYSPLLTQLPRFDVFMDLVHLNVTGNNVTNVSMSNFIGLCNLQYFTGDNLTMEFRTPCDCKKIDSWFTYVNVKSQPPFQQRCNFGKLECFEEIEPSEEDHSIHEMCRVEYQARENIRSIARICYIVLGIIGGVILFVGICYVYYRTQRLPDEPRKTNKEHSKEKTASLLPPNNNEFL